MGPRSYAAQASQAEPFEPAASDVFARARLVSPRGAWHDGRAMTPVSRRTLGLGLLILGIACAALLSTRWPSDSTVGVAPAARASGLDGSALAVPGVSPESGSNRAPITSALPETRHARVIGRVVDGLGDAIPDAAVVLRSWTDEWAAAGSGYTTTTNGLGEFALTVPLPESPHLQLRISATSFHTLGSLDFGWEPALDHAPLHQGTNDLGVIQLEAAGSAVGRIVDLAGRPVPEAQVFFVAGPPLAPPARRGPGAAEREARATADGAGRYTCAHLPPGAGEVFVRASGYRNPASVEVTILPGTEVEVPLVRLGPAPALRGRVVDATGRGLEGATVRAFLTLLTLPASEPCDGPWMAEALSGADGDFALHVPEVPEDELFCLSASLLGYEKATTPQSHELGATGVRLVLTKTEMTTFWIVDGASGAPVERFSLATSDAHELAGDAAGSEGSRHPGGKIDLPAEPGRYCYWIEASGYAPQWGPVAHAAPRQREQTIVLQPAGSIAGRVVLEGEPVAHLPIRYAESDRSPEMICSPDMGAICASPYRGWDRRIQTDGLGEFCVPALGTGRYRLSIGAQGVGDFESFVDVETGQVRDVGTIPLAREARIRGACVYPPNVLPEERRHVQLTLHGDGALEGKETVVDAKGRFEFRGLGPGKYRVDAAFSRGTDLAGEACTASENLWLEAGSTQDVRIDLRSVTPSRVSVRVRCGGTALEGTRVDVVPENGGSSILLGRTDAEGLVSTWCAPVRRAELELYSAFGLPLGRAPRTVVIEGGEPLELVVCPAAGTLVVQWPPMGRVDEIRLYISRGATGARAVGTHVVIDASSPPPGTKVGQQTCAVWPLQPGEYRVRLELRVGGTSVRFARKRVSVLAEREGVCTFSEPDRIR
jgi:hypothetical protein